MKLKRVTGHPHRRGELPEPEGWGNDGGGPSPQAWGTQGGGPRVCGPPRAIPTGVGNSSAICASSSLFTGHPHRRGELSHSRVKVLAVLGPSPQAWGTPHLLVCRPLHGRAIPTGVGNSAGRGRGRRGPAGHPHRRGELPTPPRPRRGFFGPSPQAWGTPECARSWCAPGRAIPTGVGNSTQGELTCPEWTGHPHRRGELVWRTEFSISGDGPSPQAWGTP